MMFFLILKVLQDFTADIGIFPIKNSHQSPKESSFNKADLLEMKYSAIVFHTIFSSSFKHLISYFSDKIWRVLFTNSQNPVG